MHGGDRIVRRAYVGGTWCGGIGGWMLKTPIEVEADGMATCDTTPPMDGGWRQ